MADKLQRREDEHEATLVFHCPGCGGGHSFRIRCDESVHAIYRANGRSQGAPMWTWNGSMDAPTFAPSLLVNKDFPESRCHLIMTDGKIAFCPDSHHALKGTTVDCPVWE